MNLLLLQFLRKMFVCLQTLFKDYRLPGLGSSDLLWSYVCFTESQKTTYSFTLTVCDPPDRYLNKNPLKHNVWVLWGLPSLYSNASKVKNVSRICSKHNFMLFSLSLGCPDKWWYLNWEKCKCSFERWSRIPSCYSYSYWVYLFTCAFSSRVD